MPLYLQLLELLKAEYNYIHGFKREFKFSLGEDIVNLTWEIIDLFIEVQTTRLATPQKKQVVAQIATKFDCLKLRIRFATELKQLSIKQASQLNKMLASIGKMIGSWIKNV